MKVTINARQMNVRESTKALVLEKLRKLDKYFQKEADAVVTFSHKRDKKNLEVTISAAGTMFRSEVEDDTFQNALDRSIDAIERQIRKNKTRLEKRLRSDAFTDVYDIDESIEEDEEEFKIRRKTFSYKPMSVDEAILQMNLLDHEFFVFEDQDTAEICVVYKRRDGNYGLISPQ